MLISLLWVVGLAPSPAISSFIFYEEDQIPRWINNIIVGSLAGSNLYRLVLQDNHVIRMETLISQLDRFRDIEMSPTGEVFLLLEHTKGSKIVKIVPEIALGAAGKES